MRGAVVDLGEDEGRERGGARGGGRRVLGEYCGIVGDAGTVCMFEVSSN